MIAELPNCRTAELLKSESDCCRRESNKNKGPMFLSSFHTRLSIRQFGSSAVRQSGLTLVELIVAITILMILTGAAMPIVRLRIVRERETILRRDLWEMRDAIDRYKDAADRGAFQTKVDAQGYPPDLDELVK